MRVLGLFLLTFLLFSCSKESEITEPSPSPGDEIKAETQSTPEEDKGSNLRAANGPWLVLGTRSHPCGKDDDCYCTGDKGFCLIIGGKMSSEKPSEDDLVRGQGFGTLKVHPKLGFVDLTLLGDFELDRSPFFEVREDHRLNEEVCDAYGFDSILLKAGNYRVDYSDYRHGKIRINASIRE